MKSRENEKKNQIRNEVVVSFVSSNKLSFFYFLLCNVRIVRWIRSNICLPSAECIQVLWGEKKTQWNSSLNISQARSIGRNCKNRNNVHAQNYSNFSPYLYESNFVCGHISTARAKRVCGAVIERRWLLARTRLLLSSGQSIHGDY